MKLKKLCNEIEETVQELCIMGDGGHKATENHIYTSQLSRFPSRVILMLR